MAKLTKAAVALLFLVAMLATFVITAAAGLGPPH